MTGQPRRITRRQTLEYGAFGLGALLLPVAVQQLSQRQVVSTAASDGHSDHEHEPSADLTLRQAASGSSGSALGLLDVAKVRKYEVDLPNGLDLRIAPQQRVDPQSGVGYDYHELTMRQGTHEFIPGLTTRVWGYNGQFPGPTIEAQHGREIRAKFTNDLQLPADAAGRPWPTSVHYHGGITAPEHDGYAGDCGVYYPDGSPMLDAGGQPIRLPTELRQGMSWTYVYPNRQTATLNFYHDHGLHHTSENVYRGLVGFYLQRDSSERRLQDRGYLPTYPHEVAVVLQDKLFYSDGQLAYEHGGFSGVIGNVQTVNGTAWPRMRVQPRKYRFRILNGSIWRRYDLTLSNGRPFLQLGTDSGFLNEPVSLPMVRLYFAERTDVIIDFSGLTPGTKVKLLNKAKESAGTPLTEVMQFEVEAAPAGMVDTRLPDAADFRAAGIGWEVLTGRATVSAALSYMRQNRITREFRFERKDGYYVINGKTWDPNRYDAEPRLGTTEVWTFRNTSGGWWHPVHMHLIDFQLIDRNGKPPQPWERGRKDVTALGEGETIRVIVKWDAAKYLNFTGPYMFHCHNTDHEDHDMMTQFKVRV